MGSAVLDDRGVQGMSPKQRQQMKSGPQKKKKKGRGKLTFFLLYGIACAVGGVYFERHLLPQTRIWFGQQVQTLGGLGAEQEILGHLEQTGISEADKTTAMANVRSVYAAKRAGSLSESQLEELARAERPFTTASAGKRPVNPDDLKDSLESFASLAGR